MVIIIFGTMITLAHEAGGWCRRGSSAAHQLGFERHAAWVVLSASSVRLKDA
jgi:hypothetical protein